MQFFNQFLSIVLNILFPPVCLVCRNHLKTKNELSLLLCENCRKNIPVSNSFICPICFCRLPQLKNLCHPKAKFILAACTSYQNKTARELIHTLKYQGIKSTLAPIKELFIQPYLEKVFENWLPADLSADFVGRRPLRRPKAEALAKMEVLTQTGKLNIGNFILVPIPLHPKKERGRGFNQSLIIANILCKLLTSIPNFDEQNNNQNIYVLPVLSRRKNTLSQTELKDYKQRENNVSECFVARKPELVKDKNIILIDDVFTSGATMKEAVRVLKLAGAKKIIGFVIAKA